MLFLLFFFFFNDTATTEIYTYDTLFPYTTLFRSAGGELLALLGPVVAGDSRLAATASHCRGFLGMADQMLDRPRDGARVGGIHQESAAGRLHDLAPMPEVGGDNRQIGRAHV